MEEIILFFWLRDEFVWTQIETDFAD